MHRNLCFFLSAFLAISVWSDSTSGALVEYRFTGLLEGDYAGQSYDVRYLVDTSQPLLVDDVMGTFGQYGLNRPLGDIIRRISGTVAGLSINLTADGNVFENGIQEGFLDVADDYIEPTFGTSFEGMVIHGGNTFGQNQSVLSASSHIYTEDGAGGPISSPLSGIAFPTTAAELDPSAFGNAISFFVIADPNLGTTVEVGGPIANVEVNIIPEPGSLAFGLAGVLIGAASRRTKK